MQEHIAPISALIAGGLIAVCGAAAVARKTQDAFTSGAYEPGPEEVSKLLEILKNSEGIESVTRVLELVKEAGLCHGRASVITGTP